MATSISNRATMLTVFIITFGIFKNADGGDLVIQHSIFSASTGWSVFSSPSGEWNAFPFDGSLYSFGIGNEHFLIGTKVFEFFTPTLAPQGITDFSFLPLYLYITNGLYSGRSMRTPVIYGFLGVNRWSCGIPTEMDLDAVLHAGAGIKWTFWVGSLNLAADWRRDYWSYYTSGHQMRGDIFALKAGVELGGWWSTEDIGQFKKTRWGKPIFAGYLGVGIITALPAILLLLHD